MTRLRQLCICIVFISAISCKTSRVSRAVDDGKLEVDFVQVNDVYEIAPLDDGKIGGIARVATLKKQYLKQNPNTLLVMAGDFVSPSVYNSLKYKDTAIRGRQMIEAMDTAGFDIAVFGNHEFDIKEMELQQRINESNFLWISSNSFHLVNGNVIPFAKNSGTVAVSFPGTYIQTFKDADGTNARIGFIGLTIPFNKADYVSYTDPLATAVKLYDQIKDSCDAVVAITHQSVDDDKKLAEQLPNLALIIGGHEHDMRFEKVGNIYITKAHANAKSAFIIKLVINKKLMPGGGRHVTTSATPELKYLDSTVALDIPTNAVVRKWVSIANENYNSLGFDAERVVIQNGEPLDGRETEIRSRSTNLSQLVVHSMEDACPQAELAIINAGSIRVDDVLNPPVTEYDILRALPFGGAIREVDMKGSLLIKVLDAGKNNKDIGGFLQYSSFVELNSVTNTWTINKKPIDPEQIYRVALGEFLFSGKEANLDFLNPTNPEIVEMHTTPLSADDPQTDIRLAIVKYLLKKHGRL
jgi:2',3'-cyclic-nucleotide 2'-phosphodiesterase (5'-nucleotidase family)